MVGCVQPQLAGEGEQHLGVITRSWFLTFACGGFELVLSKTRGQFRLRSVIKSVSHVGHSDCYRLYLVIPFQKGLIIEKSDEWLCSWAMVTSGMKEKGFLLFFY